MTPGPFLLLPEVTLPEETDRYTLQVIQGIKELQELIPTLKDCKTIPEINKIRSSCQLIQTYAQKRSLDKSLVQWAARCALHCERRIGELLERMKANNELHRKGRPSKKVEDPTISENPENPGIKNPENPGITLKALGLDSREASNAVALAKVTEPELDSLMDENIARTGRVSEEAIAKSIRHKLKPLGSIKKKSFLTKAKQYWSLSKAYLDKFTPTELDKLPKYWQENFAEYLTRRKAKLEEVNNILSKQQIITNVS